MKTVTIGIMPQEKREQVLAIAKGEYKPAGSEPNIWFTYICSMVESLSTDNRILQKIIEDDKQE